jgi:hypothetical protein
MSYSFSEDQIMMHKIWRKAFREGQITLKMPSHSDAVKLRFGLYNAIRPIRQGKAIDAELLQAASECSINLEGNALTIQLKSKTAMMQAVVAALGEDAFAPAATPVSAEEAEILESQRRLLERVQNPDKETPVIHDPYNTRDRG